MIKIWNLKEWNKVHSDKEEEKFPPMTSPEILEAIYYLRNNNYPKPEDCPHADCPDYRPACSLGICRVAVGMCGDF